MISFQKLAPLFLSFFQLTYSDELLVPVSDKLLSAYTLLDEGNAEDAKRGFQDCHATETGEAKAKALLGLIKISLKEGKFEEAKTLLEASYPEIEKHFETLAYEWRYAFGDLYFHLGDYQKSLEWFEKARPKKNHALAPWGKKTVLRILETEVALMQGKTFSLSEKEKISKNFDELLKNYQEMLDPIETVTLFLQFSPYFSEKDLVRQAVTERLLAETNREKKKEGLLLLAKGLEEKELDSALSLYRIAESLEGEQKDLFLQEKIACCLIEKGDDNSRALAEKILLSLEKEEPDSSKFLEIKLLASSKNESDRMAALKLLEKDPSENAQFVRGKLLFDFGNFSLADEAFALAGETQDPLIKKEALYWQARARELSLDSNAAKELYVRFIESYPEDPRAPECAFSCYSIQEYLLGSKEALKHLHAFTEQYPDSPLAIHAFYLQGLDFLHDRRSPEGRWISRKSFTSAIDRFDQAESSYKRLKNEGKLNDNEYSSLASLAKLERAKANFEIGKEASGVKKKIYLDYSEEVLHELLLELPNPDKSLQTEALFYLILTQKEGGNFLRAKTSIKELKNALPSSQNGYFVAKALIAEAEIAKEENRLQDGLSLLDEAEKMGEMASLSHDDRLEILIKKSDLLASMGSYDLALKSLSTVVDTPVVSSQRLKAMWLRAKIWEQQGRAALAKKQLESLAQKGGEYGAKAKETLEKEYRFE